MDQLPKTGFSGSGALIAQIRILCLTAITKVISTKNSPNFYWTYLRVPYLTVCLESVLAREYFEDNAISKNADSCDRQ